MKYNEELLVLKKNKMQPIFEAIFKLNSEQIKCLIQQYCEYDLKNYKVCKTLEEDIPREIILSDSYDSYEITWNGLGYLAFPDGFHLLCELDELEVDYNV